MARIYLDNNATTRVDPVVAAAVADTMTAGWGNPESAHAAGTSARRAIAAARADILARLGAVGDSREPDVLVFTSGATEANHLALGGLRQGRSLPPPAASVGRPPSDPPAGPRAVLFVSAVEHASVLAAAEAMDGHRVERLPVDDRGRVDLAHLAGRLAAWSDRPAGEPADRPRLLVSVQHANQETGVLQPVAEIAALARRSGALVHTDATQTVGKLSVDFRGLGVDALTFSGHKLHGPPGIGGLIVRAGTAITPLFAGGHQQGGLRAGTEPTALIVGLAAAIDLATADPAATEATLTRLRERFEAELRARVPTAVILGPPAERVPQTTCVAFPGHDRQALRMALDLEGIDCATGSACASGSSEPSPVLAAMGVGPDLLRSALRFSVGRDTTEAEVRDAAARIAAVLARTAFVRPDRRRGADRTHRAARTAWPPTGRRAAPVSPVEEPGP